MYMFMTDEPYVSALCAGYDSWRRPAADQLGDFRDTERAQIKDRLQIICASRNFEMTWVGLYVVLGDKIFSFAL